MTAIRRLAAVLVAVSLAAGCTLDTLPPILDPEPAPRTPAVDASAQQAIAACLARAETQGLNVSGVDRSDEIRTVDGVALGQNVFLDVGSGGQSFTVRCSYTYASAEARIMTL